MLDMGGVGQIGVDTRINVGKNNKVRAVALDFHLITRSIEERRRQALAEKENASGGVGGNKSNIQKPASASEVEPDISLVQKMANLLNIQLGGNSSKPTAKDDLSAILAEEATLTAKKTTPPKASVTSPPTVDVRSKYAKKLRNKIDGGVAGLELAKSEKEETMKRGDASMHMAARDLLSSEGMAGTDAKNTSSSRWLAATGVGKLLSFLTSRSVQIVLLPLPSTARAPVTEEDVRITSEEMECLTRQLPNVDFNVLIPDGRRRGCEGTERSNDNAAEDVLQNVLSELDDVPPLKFVVVSDRDDYLKAARDAGMFTCRIRPKNKPRGNITTDYNVEDAVGVMDIINEINGISFNSAMKG